MAVPQKIQNRTEEIVQALKEDRNLPLSDRDDYIEIMTQSAEGTNGLTTDQKLQACAENTANLCYLYIRDKLEGGGGGRAGLYRLIYKCRNQIVVIVLGAFALLAFRPQLAAILEHFIK